MSDPLDDLRRRTDEFLAGVGPPTDPIQYIMDLEALVRWLALAYSWEDPNTGEVRVNDPIWTTYDQYGNHLPAAEKLQRTWEAVMYPEGRGEPCCDNCGEPGDPGHHLLPSEDNDRISVYVCYGRDSTRLEG